MFAQHSINHFQHMTDPRTLALTLFAANVALTAATFGIPRAVARQSVGGSFWVEYDCPIYSVCFHTEGCARRREAELRFERAVIETIAYGPQ